MKLLVAGTAISGPQQSGMQRSVFSRARVELRLLTKVATRTRRPEARTRSRTSMRSLVSPLWLMPMTTSPSRRAPAASLRKSPGSRGWSLRPATRLKNTAAALAAWKEVPQATM